jgi:DNA sulfur modification protein DndB
MTISEISRRVDYAQDIHTDEQLSRLIQRQLEGKRAVAIAQYLANTNERFFNSLVLATYEGRPEWLEIRHVEPHTDRAEAASLPEDVLETLGFLSLAGSERIFAVDGQHRLAGIKRAIKDGVAFAGERLPVIFVAHVEKERERTRRLFTTLNKSAKAVKKSDIIALDEDDTMAITARRMVEDHKWFASPKILVDASDAMPKTNTVALTTLGNLYDILKIIFRHASGKANDTGLRFYRPSDTKLDEYYDLAIAYFEALAKAFPDLAKFFKSRDPTSITPQYRGQFGGHVLFRPAGLKAFTAVVVAFAKHHHTTIPAAVHVLRKMPINLGERPYVNVLWDPERTKMIPPGKKLATDLMAHVAGLPGGDKAKLRAAYALAHGVPASQIRLPKTIV